MKTKLLVIAPKLPDKKGNSRDRRFSAILEALAASCEVHLLYSQQTEEEPKAAGGIRLLNYKTMGRRVPFEVFIRELIEAEGYAVILLNTFFTAKYYLPYLAGCAGRSVIAVDAAMSQYLMGCYFARKSATTQQRLTVLREAEKNRIKELAVYSQADLVLVENEEELAHFSGELPEVEVRSIAAADGEPSREDIVAAFRNACKKQQRGEFRDRVDILFVPRETDAIDAHPLNAANAFLSEPARIAAAPEGGNFIERCNALLGASKAEYALLITDRMVLPEPSLRALFLCAESNPLNSIVIPSSNVGLGNVTTYRGLRDFFPKHFNINFGNWHELRTIKQIDGNCLFVRRELLDRIGLLDTRYATLRYALYDLCQRAFQIGHRAIINHESFVFHDAAPLHTEETLASDNVLLLRKWCDEGTEFLESLHE